MCTTLQAAACWTIAVGEQISWDGGKNLHECSNYVCSPKKSSLKKQQLPGGGGAGLFLRQWPGN